MRYFILILLYMLPGCANLKPFIPVDPEKDKTVNVSRLALSAGYMGIKVIVEYSQKYGKKSVDSGGAKDIVKSP